MAETHEAASLDQTGTCHAPMDVDAAPPVAAGALENTASCTICLEDVDSIAKLPCSCKVLYCIGCWDRALAASLQACGYARCPTCRSPLRVDFDPEASRLVFSTAVTEEVRIDPEDGMPKTLSTLREQCYDCFTEHEVLEYWNTACTNSEIDHAVYGIADECYWGPTAERLAYQVCPVQERILRNYASVHLPLEACQDIRMESSLGALVEQRVRAGLQPPPRCVCGNTLRRLPISERGCPSSIMCDLCGSNFEGGSSVWTCEGGVQTVVHPGSYDICDHCFSQLASTCVVSANDRRD